ncbi:MAG: hypothetical protein ACK4SY_06995 [Pyrobaculum sp.]
MSVECLKRCREGCLDSCYLECSGMWSEVDLEGCLESCGVGCVERCEKWCGGGP